MTMTITDEFVQKVATTALSDQIERVIRRRVKDILDDLISQLLGHSKPRKGPRRGLGSRLPDFQKFIREQLEDACVAWVREALGDGLGKDLLIYVMEQCEITFDEEEEEEEEDCEECERPANRCVC